MIYKGKILYCTLGQHRFCLPIYLRTSICAMDDVVTLKLYSFHSNLHENVLANCI